MSKVYAACSIAVYNDKVLLLLRDNIPNIPDPNTWQHIGGDLNEGETYDNALLREYEEELSIRPQSFKRLGRLDLPNGNVDMVYLVSLSDEEVENLKKGEEGQELKFFTYEELEGLDLFTQFTFLYKPYLKTILEGGSEVEPEKLGLKEDNSETP